MEPIGKAVAAFLMGLPDNFFEGREQFYFDHDAGKVVYEPLTEADFDPPVPSTTWSLQHED